MADSKQQTPGAARTHGEVQVDLGGGARGSVAASDAPLEKILGIARDIWNEVRRSGVGADDDAGNDRLLKDLQVKYKDFSISYPIPFRWMVQAREFDARTFESWLRKSVKVMYEDRKEFLAAQGEYLVSLYKTRNPRAGVRQINRYREAIQKALEKDDEEFARAREQAEETVRQMDEENDAERRQRLVAYLTRLKAEREAAKSKDVGGNAADVDGGDQ